MAEKGAFLLKSFNLHCIFLIKHVHELDAGDVIADGVPRPKNGSCNSQHDSGVEDELKEQHEERHENLDKDVEQGSLPPEKPNQIDEPQPQALDPDLVDWDGPDDPDNPMNWPRGRKLVVTASISAITLLTYVFRPSRP